MKNGIKIVLFSACLGLFLSLVSSCKNTDPSVMKVYVRSASNELLQAAQVIIIGDVNSTPPTLPYVDTLESNSSGFAQFSLDSYYSTAGESNPVSYFDVIVKRNGKQATGYVRCRIHITSVETIYLPD